MQFKEGGKEGGREGERDPFCTNDYNAYVESKKVGADELFREQKLCYRCRKQTYGYQGGKGDSRNLGLTILYVKEITNKNLLWSTGNAIVCNDLYGEIL